MCWSFASDSFTRVKIAILVMKVTGQKCRALTLKVLELHF